jgi:dihydroneopterin aldolase
MIPATYDLIFNDIRLPARIGVYDHERGKAQEIVIHLMLTVPVIGPDMVLEDSVDFAWVMDQLKSTLAEQHWDLVETLCIKIGDALFQDARIQIADIAVLKTEEIKETSGVGTRFVFRR